MFTKSIINLVNSDWNHKCNHVASVRVNRTGLFNVTRVNRTGLSNVTRVNRTGLYNVWSLVLAGIQI